MRWNVWPTMIPLQTKLNSNKRQLEKTHHARLPVLCVDDKNTKKGGKVLDSYIMVFTANNGVFSWSKRRSLIQDSTDFSFEVKDENKNDKINRRNIFLSLDICG